MDLLILFLLPLVNGQNLAEITQSYFKSCLHFQENWNQLPSHPLQLNSIRKKTEKCRSYKCLILSDTLDLTKLKDFKCYTDYDCAPDISGMICSNHSVPSYGQTKYCSCPPGYAYSTTECRCRPAELCWSNKDPCHKGMKCRDHKCSCLDLENLLYEIHGGLCVEPRTTHFGMDRLLLKVGQQPEQTSTQPEVVIVALLAAFVILGLLAIGLYVLSVKRAEIDLCARGDYVCDHDTITPGNRQNQPHVTAWDAPGMDFLSEEQTLKYLNRSNSIEVTKSPSMATTAELVDEAPSPSGSLPECEQRGATRNHLVITAETNFENPTFSRHSSESKESEEDTNSVTKASNIL